MANKRTLYIFIFYNYAKIWDAMRAIASIGESLTHFLIPRAFMTFSG